MGLFIWATGYLNWTLRVAGDQPLDKCLHLLKRVEFFTVAEL